MSMESDEPKFKKSAWSRGRILLAVVVILFVLAFGILIGYFIGYSQKESPSPVHEPVEAAQSETKRFVLYINNVFWLFVYFELSWND